MQLVSQNNSPIDLQRLQSFVPLNELTSSHMESLMREHEINVYCEKQELFPIGAYDNCHHYLLSGEVELIDHDGNATILSANDPESRFPLAHFQPRRVQARAHSDCRVLRFDSDHLDAMLAWDQAASYIIQEISGQRELDEDADWMLTLLRSNLFYKVPPMNIRKILHSFSSKFWSAGDTVIRQGELGDCCYFIKEGSVEVYRAEDENAEPELIAELGPGFCFGEDALVNDAARNATVKMGSNGVLMRLEKQDFYQLLKQPEVSAVSLKAAMQQVENGAIWVDVRSQDEYELGHAEAAVNFPLNLLQLKARLLNHGQEYIVYCNTGRRSVAAAALLAHEGHSVSFLQGGVGSYSVDQQAYFEAQVTGGNILRSVAG